MDLSHSLGGEAVAVRGRDEQVRIPQLVPASDVELRKTVAEGPGGTPSHDINVVLAWRGRNVAETVARKTIPNLDTKISYTFRIQDMRRDGLYLPKLS